MRRKDFRRRRKYRTERLRHRKTNPYHLWQVAIVITGVLYYYLQEDRSTFFIIGMDALVANQISPLTARSISSALCKNSEERWSTPPWSTPPWSTPPNRSERFPESSNPLQMGHSTGFLLYLQRIWNRPMHNYTGNPVLLSLNQLIPDDHPRSTVNYSKSSGIPRAQSQALKKISATTKATCEFTYILPTPKPKCNFSLSPATKFHYPDAANF